MAVWLMVIPIKKKTCQRSVFAQIELRSLFQHAKTWQEAFWPSISCVRDHWVCIMAQLTQAMTANSKTSCGETISRSIGRAGCLIGVSGQVR